MGSSWGGVELQLGDEAPTKVSWKVDNLEEEEETDGEKGDNRDNWEGVEVQLIPCLLSLGGSVCSLCRDILENESKPKNKWHLVVLLKDSFRPKLM